MSKQIDARCPECDYAVDDATGVGEAAGDRPEAGNIAICIRCAAIGVYEDNEDGTLGLRMPTEEEKVELSEEPEITKTRAAIIGMTELWMKP